MKCSACGRPARKRTRAFVLGFGMQNVCAKCAGDGLVVCKAPVDRRCVCGNYADVCSKCVDEKVARPSSMQKDIAKRLRQLSKLAEKRFKDEKEDYEGGRAEGLEQAASIVEAWGRNV